MTRTSFNLLTVLGAVSALLLPVARVAGQHLDIEVGRTAAGQLAIEADLDEATLLEAVDGLLRGWSGADPGWEALEADEPEEDLFQLASGANIFLEIVEVDEGLKFWAAAFAALADEAGERVPLGGSDLHTHTTFHIDSDVVGTGFRGTLAATLKLVDTGSTGYADSEPFVMTFTNVPEPGTVMLAMATAGFFVMRRRRGEG